MKDKHFLFLISIITILSLGLRVMDYDKMPPVNEAFDEVHYAWGGATWIINGVPKSWSNFDSYKNVENIERYSIRWRLVSPVVEKPPFYFLLSGLIVVLSRPADIFSVSHSIIRILPLALSVPSIFLTGILARKIFGDQIAVLAAILYGVTPTIVLANRMSVTENLMTPLALIALILVANFPKAEARKIINAACIGIICFISILTKQIGITLPLTAIVLFGIRKEIKAVSILVTFSLFAILTYITIGAYFDWHLFTSLQNDVRIGHTLSGLPEMVASIFRFPTTGPKNHPFLDGTILLGYILLFSGPLWHANDKNKSTFLLLTFPFIYLLLLALGESGAGAFTFFGWYLYPLFPFLIILVAKFFYDFWQKPTFFLSLIIGLILGSSTIRFIFLLTDRKFHYLWQYSYIILILLILVLPISKKRISRAMMIALFMIFIIANILIIFNLPSVYKQVSLNDQSLKGF